MNAETKGQRQKRTCMPSLSVSPTAMNAFQHCKIRLSGSTGPDSQGKYMHQRIEEVSNPTWILGCQFVTFSSLCQKTRRQGAPPAHRDDWPWFSGGGRIALTRWERKADIQVMWWGFLNTHFDWFWWWTVLRAWEQQNDQQPRDYDAGHLNKLDILT